MTKETCLIILLICSVVFAQSLPDHNRPQPYFLTKEYFDSGVENSFQIQACSLFNVKHPQNSSQLLDFVTKYHLNFGYSCCISTLPDSFVLLNPHWIFNLSCGDSTFALRAADSLRKRVTEQDENTIMHPYYDRLQEVFQGKESYPISELKEHALEKIIHATVAYDLFSQISDTSLLKSDINHNLLKRGTLFNLDMYLNDLLFNDTLYRKMVFDAFTKGVALSGADSLLNMMFYFEHLANDSAWYASAVKNPFWNFLLAPYRKFSTKATFLELCNRIFLYDSLSESSREFLANGSKELFSQSFIEKYAWNVQTVLDTFAALLNADTLDLILFNSAEFKAASAGLLKLQNISSQTDTSLYNSITALSDIIKKRIQDSIEICSVINCTQSLHLPITKPSPTSENTLPFKQYGTCNEINSLAAHGNTIFAGTNSGLIEIDKKNWCQKYYTPFNSPLKSQRINEMNFNNGTLSIVSKCMDLVTYDGCRWQSFTYNDSTLEYSDEIRNITVASDGTVWMIYDDYIVCSVTGQDTVFIDYENKPFSKKAPSRLIADKKGNVWFVARNSILCNNGKEWVIFDSSNTILSGSELKSLCHDSCGAIWTSSNDMLYRYDGSQWESFRVPVHPLARSGIRHLTFDRNGTLWIAFFDGLASYDFKTWKLYSSLNIGSIQDIAVDNDCTVWLGTYNGLWLLNSDTCRQIEAGNADLPCTITCGVMEDTAGVLWIGGSDGLSMRSNGMWKKIRTQHGFDHLFCKNTGRFIGGSRKGYIFELVDTTISILYRSEPNYDERLYQIALDSGGGIWASFYYHLVHLKDSLSIDTVKLKQVSSRDISSIMVSHAGDVWVTASSWNDAGSASLLRNGTWSTFSKKNSEIKDNNVKVLHEDSKGAVWFTDGHSGSYADLLRFDGKRWKRFELWYLLGLNSRSTNAVCGDHDGNVWVGTDKGLASWDGKKWWIYPVKEGVWSNGINTITIDRKDTMWITSGNTILSVARKDLSLYRKTPNRLKKRQTDPDSWYLHAQFASNPDSAMYYINKAIKLNKKDPSYYVRRAETFHFLKKYSNALKDMKLAVALGDSSFHGKTILGEIWLALGDLEKAMEYSSAAIRIDSSSTRPYVVRSLVYYNTDQADSALKYFNRILAKEPKEYPQIYALKAKIFNDRIQYDSAEICISKSLALDTTHADVFFIRAMIHLKQFMFADAVKAFNKALELSPRDIGSIQNRGYCFLMMDKFDSAFKDFDEVIRLGEKSSDAFCNRGVTFFKLGKHKEAEKDFKHALKLSSDNLALCVNYISLLASQERYNEAVYFFSTIPAQLQQDHQITAAIGLTYIHLKDYNNALRFLHKAIKTDSTDWSPCYNVACIHARQGNAALAIEWLEKAFDRGFRQFDFLEKDTDFDIIRDTKAFVELIKRYIK